MGTRKVVMTIAGSDSGGGAGLQADLKTFSSLGVFGTSVVTAITAQNTRGVTNSVVLDDSIIESQFDAVVQDLRPAYAKTGMLGTGRVIRVVKRKRSEYGIPLVLDPVMVSKTGFPLTSEDIVPPLMELAKESVAITPNIYEAERLSGSKIVSETDAIEVSQRLSNITGSTVVIKGGQLFKGKDFLSWKGSSEVLKGESVETKNVHGSGDVFSAAITSFLAKGYNEIESIRRAKEFVTLSLKHSLDLGRGIGPVDPYAPIEVEIERERLREDLERLVFLMEKELRQLNKLVLDDEKINIAGRTTYGETGTLAGGIIRYLEWTKVDGPIVLNHDNLVSRALRDSGRRLAISFSPIVEILNRASSLGLKVTGESLMGDICLYKGRAILMGDSVEDLIGKLRRILS